MTFDFTVEEIQWLVNSLINPDQAAPITLDVNVRFDLANAVRFLSPVQLNAQQVGILQGFLQELAEQHGRQATTANEKQPINPGSRFRPRQTLVFIDSISKKLGASLHVDTTQHSDLHSPNEPGSRGIMGKQGLGIS